MKAACLFVRSLATTTEGAPPGGTLGTHVARCLSCQAELARYRRLRRQLGSLAEVVEPVPLLPAATIEHEMSTGSAGDTPSKRSPQVGRAAAGGAVAAAAAGAAAVIMWRHSKAAV